MVVAVCVQYMVSNVCSWGGCCTFRGEEEEGVVGRECDRPPDRGFVVHMGVRCSPVVEGTGIPFVLRGVCDSMCHCLSV